MKEIEKKYVVNEKANPFVVSVLDFIESREIVMFNNTISNILSQSKVGRYLQKGLAWNVGSIITYKNIQKQIGALGYFNYEDKSMALDFHLCKISACADVIENSNISDEEKKVIFDAMKKEGLVKAKSFNGIEKEIINTKACLSSILTHEITHAKDFAKVDVRKLDTASVFLFTMASEINAYKNEWLSILENKSHANNRMIFQSAPELSDYYERNNLKLGEIIPNNHIKNINAILIKPFFFEKATLGKQSRYEFYQIRLLSSVKKTGGEPMPLDEICKKIGLNVDESFLRYIGKQFRSPINTYVAKLFKNAGIELYKNKELKLILNPFDKIRE